MAKTFSNTWQTGSIWLFLKGIFALRKGELVIGEAGEKATV